MSNIKKFPAICVSNCRYGLTVGKVYQVWKAKGYENYYLKTRNDHGGLTETNKDNFVLVKDLIEE